MIYMIFSLFYALNFGLSFWFRFLEDIGIIDFHIFQFAIFSLLLVLFFEIAIQNILGEMSVFGDPSDFFNF